MKTATITVDYVDANGLPKQMTTTVQYDPNTSADIVTIEYLNQNSEGPLMRPKKPRS